ncbi:MAG TPA: hypothetical protein VG934_01430 [Candidatus Paceibacterota bacterium]|nr:hypothetical protein [Candidatus Paceibacterota bacterium]
MIKIAGIIAGIAGAIALAGCTTAQGDSGAAFLKDASSTATLVGQSSATVTVRGPYDAAMACISKIPEVHSLKIGVGLIADQTGKVNTATEDGTGAFVGNGASNMFNSALAQVGVQLIELSPEYRADIDWVGAKGIKGAIAMPNYMLMGSVSSLDFLPGSMGTFQVFGIGPGSRAYTALGSMDTRLVTLPYGSTDGGLTVATSSAAKQFAAVEDKFGVGTFVGSGNGLTYASFEVDNGHREPMQSTLRFLVDYEVVDLLGNFIDSLSAARKISDRRSAVAECRTLLQMEGAPAPQTTQVASAT